MAAVPGRRWAREPATSNNCGYINLIDMDWSTEGCLRSVKRRLSGDHPCDQLSKVSRLAFPSMLSGTNLLNHETPRADDCDLSCFTLQPDVFQLTLQSDNVYPQPEVICKPIHSDFHTPHLKPKIPDVAVSEIEKRSFNIVNITDSSIIAQKSKQSTDKCTISRTYPSKQSLQSNSHLLSNDRGCPDCAAGQSGHIRHIGRWRLMDSL